MICGEGRGLSRCEGSVKFEGREGNINEGNGFTEL